MKLSRIKLENFRNYKELDIEFADGLTILQGQNGQGKTNVLEAIFLLSVAKSHRTNNDREMISWGEEYAVIKGQIQKKDYDFPLELILNPKGKIAKYNHLEQQKLSQFIGHLNVVLFAPEDLQLIKGSPSFRRRFIDTEIGQAHPVYLNNLLEYQKILQQRNSYLKEHGGHSAFDPIYYEVITEQLIEKAVNVISDRLEFVEKLTHLANGIHKEIGLDSDELVIEYVSSASSKFDYKNPSYLKEQFIEAFKEGIDREKQRGYTIYGPHRDDLKFFLNDKEAQLYASQGQQRTIILALKLAELELLKEIIGEYPILLLDDVLSELDSRRQQLLMELIEERVQTFLTTTSVEDLDLDNLHSAQVLTVNQGQIR